MGAASSSRAITPKVGIGNILPLGAKENPHVGSAKSRRGAAFPGNFL